MCITTYAHIMHKLLLHSKRRYYFFNPSPIASIFLILWWKDLLRSVCNVYTFIQLLAPTKSYLTQTFTCLFCEQLSPSHIKHKHWVNESQRNKGNECHYLYDPTKSLVIGQLKWGLSVREFITVSYSLLFVHMLIYVQSSCAISSICKTTTTWHN